MSKPRRSNPAPVTSPAAEPGTEPADEPARLHISLEAAAGVGALMQTRAAIERICPEPLRFLGPVDGRLKLNLEIADPGCCHGAEKLALRIFRIAGIGRVRAERRCPRRGVVYAIHLASKRGSMGG